MFRRVLVVDDYVETAEMVCVLLEMLGCECAGVTTGAAAIELARTFAPDLVLLDLWLADMHGSEVARRLRAEPGPQPRIIAMTGTTTKETRIRALEAGVDDIEWKPLDAARLRRLVKHGGPAPANASW